MARLVAGMMGPCAGHVGRRRRINGRQPGGHERVFAACASAPRLAAVEARCGVRQAAPRRLQAARDRPGSGPGVQRALLECRGPVRGAIVVVRPCASLHALVWKSWEISRDCKSVMRYGRDVNRSQSVSVSQAAALVSKKPRESKVTRSRNFPPPPLLIGGARVIFEVQSDQNAR